MMKKITFKKMKLQSAKILKILMLEKKLKKKCQKYKTANKEKIKHLDYSI